MLKKGLSQHLIKDKNLLRKLVRLSGITDEDIVVEIGAGHGDLTRCIAEEAKSLVTVELDLSFRQYLEPLESEYSNVKVVYGDFLKIPLAQFRGERNTKVVGNIPYKITGPIIVKILKERATIESAYLMMQKEIAQRIVSKSHKREYGALSANCQIFADVKVLMYIKPEVFIPPPKVDSALLSMVFKESEKETENGLIDFVRSCFQNKRKHMRYSLVRQYGREKIEYLYEKMGFPNSIRAEEVEPLTFKEMYRLLDGPAVSSLP
jgi:16S rRNA (adenine1518-N6/adenine1519-N6)-dimethyltransferase